MFFERKKLLIIEEPERNIHPHLLSKIMEMFKEASTKKQIIITTHNPLIVKYSNIDDLFFISRDDDMFSTIFKPANTEKIKLFLANEIGIDELFIDNILGIK